MRFLFLFLLLSTLFHIEGKSQSINEKPNVVLIMADDIGFSDIGCYGSEINTPNIDKLAEQGLRFQTFYNMAKCNPTRSTLLTGQYKGGNGVVHIAQLAKEAGYYTIMTGKEHFDKWVPEYCRAQNVFDESFTYWIINNYFVPPSGEYKHPFVLNGKELTTDEIMHEKSPLYKTDFITDYALKFLDEAFKKDQPFFLYLPYHPGHFPLQARPEDIAKYRGKYMKGWDKLRAERYERQKKLGVIPENAKLSPPEGNLNLLRKPLVPEYMNYYPWNSLSEGKKDSLDLEMAVYAAMIDRMDQNIGRVLQKLEENGKLENTLILFLSDNGACPFYSNRIKNVAPGPANSYWSLRSTWANLGNTPYRQYKQEGFRGGCNTPFIAYWPGKIKAGSITDQPGHIVDIAPTFIDLMGIEYPDSIEGYPPIPLPGESLLPVFFGKQRKEPDFFISGITPFRMFRMGDYKIVRVNNGPWELYNVKDDPTELNNLAAENPKKVKELAAEYEKVKNKVLKTKEN